MKMRKAMFSLCMFLCMMFLIQIRDVKAAPTDGTAYAVLTDNSNGQEAGELIFFRSENEYSDGSNQTVTDIMGNTYTGQVFTGIEDA